jgi:6,7-dimethyl-8-ribityllumazine synthase
VSGEGAPKPPDRPVDCHDLRVAVVAARWHEQVMDGLVAGARRALADYHVEEPSVVRVPGSFELPVMAGALARRGYEAVVALGVVIRRTSTTCAERPPTGCPGWRSTTG